jgi:Tfp pilus assembly ATPase PilU
MGLALFYPDPVQGEHLPSDGHIGVIIRQIKIQIKTIDDLGLPRSSKTLL